MLGHGAETGDFHDLSPAHEWHSTRASDFSDMIIRTSSKPLKSLRYCTAHPHSSPFHN